MHICLTELAQREIARVLRPGHGAVDATCGNGHDTRFLARQICPGGRVFALDIQPQALAAARRRLEQEGLAGPVEWILGGHEHLHKRIPPDWHGRLRAVMFNLGYLPGGSRHIITRARTTVAALDAALGLLAPGGCITVVAYTGHPGGHEEAAAVTGWLARQSPGLVSWKLEIPTGQNHPPRLFVITRQ